MVGFHNQSNYVGALFQGSIRIDVVRAIGGGPNGKQCPNPLCGHAPMHRAEMVWQQQSRGFGRSNLLGLACAPPAEPLPSTKRRIPQRVLVVAAVFVAAGWALLMTGRAPPGDYLCGLVLVPLIVLYAHMRGRDADIDARAAQLYHHYLHVWRHRWTCVPCGTNVIELPIVPAQLLSGGPQPPPGLELTTLTASELDALRPRDARPSPDAVPASTSEPPTLDPGGPVALTPPVPPPEETDPPNPGGVPTA